MAPIPRTGYLIKVGLVLGLAVGDLLLNSSADHGDVTAAPAIAPVIVVAAQVLLQLLNLLLLFTLFFGTYLFQVGLIGVLLREFRRTLYGMLAYGLLYCGYGACKIGYLVGPTQSTADGLWNRPAFVALSIAQKIGALGYYALLLSACVQLGEPKWYQRGPWVSRFASWSSTPSSSYAAASASAAAGGPPEADVGTARRGAGPPVGAFAGGGSAGVTPR